MPWPRKIRTICGTGSNPVALDYVMGSHHHLDHIGYAGNPADTTSYGNGLYQLLTPGGLGFTVGTFLDHDGGTWTDTNSNGVCEVGTSTAPIQRDRLAQRRDHLADGAALDLLALRAVGAGRPG